MSGFPDLAADGRPLDTVTIVKELSAIGRELDRLSREAAAQDEKAVRARGRYRRAYAEAFTTGAGSIEDRKQAATLKCEDILLEAELADQVLRGIRDRVRILRDRLEIGRSVNAAMRTQFTTEGIGQT